jgi:hypothetical protein
MFQHLRTVLEILLAMSGVVLRRMTIARGASFLASLGIYLWAMQNNSRTVAIWYFALATLLHYVVLFGFFAKGGWSAWFIRRYGEEEGFKRCEAVMTLVFFHNGASTALACAASAGVLTNYVPAEWLTLCGIACSCVGLPIKIWATAIVGIDTYYYRDLFLRRPVGEFRVAGPYKVFRNPMYGVGHLHGYGSALLAASDMGLVMVALNQALVWLFYWTVEKPHVEEVFAEV